MDIEVADGAQTWPTGGCGFMSDFEFIRKDLTCVHSLRMELDAQSRGHFENRCEARVSFA